MPLGLTYYVISSIVGFMDGILAILPARFHPNTYLPFPVPGLGIVFTVIVIQLAGLLGANLIGRTVIRAYERILRRIPVVRGVYAAVKQLMEQILSDRADRFRRVVLVEYPRKGLYALAFVTGTSRGEVQERTEERMLNVFVPTTPNPTSGFLLHVPEREVTDLDMSVEQAFKMIVSGGIVGGEAPDDKKARPFVEGRASKAGGDEP